MYSDKVFCEKTQFQLITNNSLTFLKILQLFLDKFSLSFSHVNIKLNFDENVLILQTANDSFS